MQQAGATPCSQLCSWTCPVCCTLHLTISSHQRISLHAAQKRPTMHQSQQKQQRLQPNIHQSLPCSFAVCRMLLGLPPARYVVMAHYEAKLRQLLETANDMDGSLPLEYEITTLEVRQLMDPAPEGHPVRPPGFM